MRLWFMGPDIKSLIEKHDVPALVRVWSEATPDQQSQIRTALRRWLGVFDKERANEAARALIGLGLLDDVLKCWDEWTRPSYVTSDEVVTDSRATNLILLLCEEAVRTQRVDLATHLVKGVARWDLESLGGGFAARADRRAPLENLVPLLRDKCPPAELVDLILHAPSRDGSAAAESALQERGGSEAVAFYQQVAANGLWGLLGGSLSSAMQKKFVGEDNKLRGYNAAERRTMELQDDQLRKDARKLGQRLEVSALSHAESYPVVRSLRDISGKR